MDEISLRWLAQLLIVVLARFRWIDIAVEAGTLGPGSLSQCQGWSTLSY